jgi:hypothetical protein
MNETTKPCGSIPFAGSLAGIAVAALAGGSQQVAAAGVDVLPGTMITSLDFTDNGSSVGALNDIAGNFSNYVQNGPDVFYTFTVLTGGTMNFSVMPAAGYDTGIGLFTGTNLSPTWLAGVDIALGGGLESFSFPVTTGQTYHFVVDSFYASKDSQSQGAYTLNVTGSNGVTLVPEPGTALMIGAGALALGWRRRRRGIAS